VSKEGRVVEGGTDKVSPFQGPLDKVISLICPNWLFTSDFLSCNPIYIYIYIYIGLAYHFNNEDEDSMLL
jgi:hypothetical protein